MSPFQPFPERATAIADSVDNLSLFALFVAIFFTLLIAALILYFGLKYRRKSPEQVGLSATTATTHLEVAWSVIPLIILLFLFYWGAGVYMELSRPPSDAVQYFAIGRQWMWKFQHPDGRREINELHVPVGLPVKLTMTSEDVVHSFYVPAFRNKYDVLPGRYTTTWFKADKVGSYRLFCAEYCGTEHSKMVGRVVVLSPHEYEEWLAGSTPGSTPTASGEQIFNARGCPTCHRNDSSARAPILTGLIGRPVKLSTGETLTADETYVRESIMDPGAKVVDGYQPIMPTYRGQISEEELIQIISYIGAHKTGDVPAEGARIESSGPDAGTGNVNADRASAADAGANDGGQEQ